MTGTAFVDTNVLVYRRDASEPEKRRQAQSWMTFLWENRSGRLSAQVLNEFYVTVTRKLDPGMDVEAARRDVRNLMTWRPLSIDRPVIESAWRVQDKYGFSFWDSLIVAAAQVAACTYLLSEVLKHDQVLDGVQVISPFLKGPQDLD